MRQMNFFPSPSLQHGGSLSVASRRSRRALATNRALHLTLKSNLAFGRRSLLKHRQLINSVLNKAAKLFNIRVYRLAICGNHLHALIRGKRRVDIQNFFRVFAGHSAQGILLQCPMDQAERRKLDIKYPRKGCKKNQRQFWSFLIYSRVISWGREFAQVARYIVQNTLEALHLIAYKTRNKSKRTRAGPK